MLHVHVREDPHIRPEQGSQAQQIVRDPLDEPLVGHPRSAKHVYPDELRTRRVGDGQGGAPVVAEHVDPQRQINAPPDLARQRRHLRHHVCGNAARKKRQVAEVLQHHSVHAPGDQGFGITQHRAANCLDASAEPRRTGQRQKMQHPDDRFGNVGPLRNDGRLHASNDNRVCRSSRNTRQFSFSTGFCTGQLSSAQRVARRGG